MKWLFLIGGIGNLLSMTTHPASASEGYLSGILTALMLGISAIINAIDKLKTNISGVNLPTNSESKKVISEDSPDMPPTKL